MAGNGMEVDPPTAVSSSNSSAAPGLLKRSNSAPMINIITSSSDASPNSSTNSQTSPASSTASGPPCSIPTSSSLQQIPVHKGSLTPQHTRPTDISRIRRFSASNTSGLPSPTGKIPNRLDQIKHEETFKKEREVAHERELTSAASLTSSWDDLSLSDEPMVTDSKRPKSFNEPLHIFTSPMIYSSSPSPTRLAKQCFSPSLQQPVRNNTLTPSPSPSPTRKTFVRRSLSPITMRPSPLSGIKRKADFEEGERPESYFSPPKRFQTGSSSPIRMSFVQHPLIHHLSSTASSPASSLGSPEPNVPSTSCSPLAHQPMQITSQTRQSLSSTTVSPHNPSTSSASTSPANSSISMSAPASCFTFRPVRDSTETHATDSDQASDMTEATDISEQSDIPLMSSVDASANNSTTL